MLLSFALSVSLTRLFLELTGYPQLGGGDLHIAHLLWGGLLLFVAALLPLIFANRWVYLLGSALAGVGIGLFIDEVGKFITQTNDYFYPAAAPIIYALFLICVLLYFQLNRPTPREARAEMYTVLEMMEDILDHDLDEHEKADIEKRLHFVIEQPERPELARLGQALLEFITHEHIYLAPKTPGYVEKSRDGLLHLEQRYLNRTLFRNFLASGIGVLGFVSLVSPLQLGFNFFRSVIQAGSLAFLLQDNGRALVDWFFRLQVMQGLVGLMLVIGAGLLLTGREERGIRFSYTGLLIYLTIVNLLLFYYNQFSTIISATLQFSLLLGVLYYRQRYVQEP